MQTWLEFINFFTNGHVYFFSNWLIILHTLGLSCSFYAFFLRYLDSNLCTVHAFPILFTVAFTNNLLEKHGYGIVVGGFVSLKLPGSEIKNKRLKLHSHRRVKRSKHEEYFVAKTHQFRIRVNTPFEKPAVLRKKSILDKNRWSKSFSANFCFGTSGFLLLRPRPRLHHLLRQLQRPRNQLHPGRHAGGNLIKLFTAVIYGCS